MLNVLRDGETLFTGWSAIPSQYVAEICARAGFDSVVLDMQHGMQTTASVTDGISGIRLAGKPAIVRIPVGRFDMASRALDLGASGVIAPMINSLADAEAFVEAVKYPPVGGRSWGPNRTLMLGGYTRTQDYLDVANRDTLAIAMIETRSALDALDDILNIDGIDGIFVGPSDFSIAWTNGQKVDPVLDDMMDRIADIAARAKAAGKFSAIFLFDPKMVPKMAGYGYQLFAMASDVAYLTRGAAGIVGEAREALAGA